MDDGVAKDVLADPVLDPVSKQPLNSRGVIQDRAFRVEEADHVRGVLDQGTEAFVGPAEHFGFIAFLRGSLNGPD